MVDGVTVKGAQLNTTADSLFRTAECFASSPKIEMVHKVFSDPQIEKCVDIVSGSVLPEVRIDVDNSICGRLTLTCTLEVEQVNLLIINKFQVNCNE